MVSKAFINHIKSKPGAGIVFYCYMDGTIGLGGHCERRDKKGYSFYTNRYSDRTDEHGPIEARWIVKPKQFITN